MNVSDLCTIRNQHLQINNGNHGSFIKRSILLYFKFNFLTIIALLYFFFFLFFVHYTSLVLYLLKNFQYQPVKKNL